MRRDLRQVPDNQEVFVYPKCGVSIIVEVLQAVSAVTDEDAVKSVLSPSPPGSVVGIHCCGVGS